VWGKFWPRRFAAPQQAHPSGIEDECLCTYEHQCDPIWQRERRPAWARTFHNVQKGTANTLPIVQAAIEEILMKRAQAVGTAVLILLFGTTTLAYANQEQKDDKQEKPEKQTEPAQQKGQQQQEKPAAQPRAQQQEQKPNTEQHAQQQQEKPAHQEHAQQQEQKPNTEQHAQQQQEKPATQQHAQQQEQKQNTQQHAQQQQQPNAQQQEKAATQQHAQQQEQKQITQPHAQQQQEKPANQQHAEEQQRSNTQQHVAQQQQTKNNQEIAQRPASQPVQQQRTQQQEVAQQGEQRGEWQRRRAHSFDTEHRTWQQRGGYNGYRIPDTYYSSYYGSDHSFRVYGLPFMEVGGFPRFQYGGYWFTVVDPYPEFWGDDWYQTDDVYVVYSDNGYYLYDARYPGRPGVAISISD
jgi:hypothetical protein